ncbi:MAG: DUF542 domain-containing protein [Deltaproteobacteria bacterium]|nr:DUF542 domain-containing protein [Deltaproteobacteria bacterium]
MLNPERTIADTVLDHSECAQVFQRHRIDFCCRGHLSIETAAREKGLALDALLAELSQAIASRRGEPPADLRDLPTPHLLEHIVGEHHEYLRKALPFVLALATKVGRVHGEHNPKLRDLAVVVEELNEALLPHLDAEELRLFPALTASEPDRVALSEEFDSMTEEHLAVAKLLERTRAATDDFSVPAWACNSYRTLFSELEQLEGDVFTHVHLENHVLKPRFTSAA